MLEISSHQTFAQPTYSDPWQDIGLQNDILQLAGVKDLRRGRAKLVKAFCSWDDLLEADFASRNFGNIITKAREFYGALKKLETDRRKNAEGGEDCLYFLDDFIARETGKKGVLLLGVPDVLRSTSAVIKAFKTLKGRLGLPHERGQRRSQYYFACELVAELELAVIPLGGHFSLDATSQTGTIITAIDRLREADPDCDRILPPRDKHPVHSYKRYLRYARQVRERRKA